MLPGAGVTRDECRQCPAQDFRWSASKDLQGSSVTAGDVAFKVDGQDGDSSDGAAIESSRTRCFRNRSSGALAGARWRLRPRIEIYRWHSEGLELILT